MSIPEHSANGHGQNLGRHEPFRPFPYGVWISKEREVIFDRSYRPLFERTRERGEPWDRYRHPWRYADHDAWVHDRGEQLWFYYDGNRPQDDETTQLRLMKVLIAVTDGKSVRRYARPVNGWAEDQRCAIVRERIVGGHKVQ